MALITSPTITAQQSTDSSDNIDSSDTPHHKHQHHLDALLSRMISAKDVRPGTAQTNVSSKLSFSVDSLLANKSTAVEAAKCLTSLFTR